VHASPSFRSSFVVCAAALLALAPHETRAQVTSGDYVVHNFRFTTGEALPELRLHYRTLGTIRRDAKGVVRNAILIMHGTGGSGGGFLSRTFGGVAFAPGGVYDSTKYFIILPDGIGHGGSSKPSDGMHAHFPRYTYDDMVRADWMLLTGHLQVNHLRLVTGTSMGCMHSWVWGYTYPAFMDGLAPLACLPAQIAGRNRMMRHMMMQDIKEDPAWKGGDYPSQPPGLRTALEMEFIMVSAPLVQRTQAPTRDAADSVIDAWVAARFAQNDANDFLYAFDASRDYDPSTHLGAITAPVLAINSADDQVNPPELGVMDKLMPTVAHGTFWLIPISPATRGHGTHSLPAVWGDRVRAFLAGLPER
jgi:homoserine O-acetyltransferase/O-succinyltransferase